MRYILLKKPAVRAGFSKKIKEEELYAVSERLLMPVLYFTTGKSAENYLDSMLSAFKYRRSAAVNCLAVHCHGFNAA